MINIEHDISIQYFVDFMFYKLVNEIGNGRIECANISRKRQHGNCHFYRPVVCAGLLEGRGLATPEFYNVKW